MQQTNQTILTPSRDSSGAVLAALKAAFPQTIPVLTGYFVLGLGYGIYVQSLGLPIWLPPLMGTVVYGGSLEFVLASLLLGSFSPLSAFLMALMIQARHLFYGLTMLERYQGYGLRGFYMIYAMSDETFSITCSAEPPEGVDRGWFMFFITLLDRDLLGGQRFSGGSGGLHPAVQHRGRGFCHDSHVRGHLPQPVGERKAALLRLHRAGGAVCLPAGVWLRQFSDPVHDLHSGAAARAAQAH